MKQIAHESTALFLTTAQAAEILGLSLGTLQNWRIQGVGPPFMKFGGKVRYDKQALLEWAREQTTTSTTEATAAAG